MKLTDFSSTVKIFKKNFSLKKAKYKLAKRQVLAKRRKEREDRIEQQNAVKPLIKGAKGKVPGSNFFDNIKRFLGFTLAGLILSNLDTIISTLKDVFKKIKEIVENISDFVDGVIGGLQSFFDGLDGAKKRMEDLLSPILNADLSDFVPFQNELDKVLTGVLGIAALITGLYQGGKAGGDGNLIDETAKGSAAGVDSAAQKKAARLKALNEAKKLRAQRAAARAAAREAAAKKLRAERNLSRIAREKATQRAAEKAASITATRRAAAFGAALDEFSVAQMKARALAQQKAAQEAAQEAAQKKAAQNAAVNRQSAGSLRNKTKIYQEIGSESKAGAGRGGRPPSVTDISGRAEFGSGKKPPLTKTKTYANFGTGSAAGQVTITRGVSVNNRILEELFNLDKKPDLKAQLKTFRLPPPESPQFKAPSIPKGFFKGFNVPKIKPGNFFLELVRREATQEKMLSKTPPIQGPQLLETINQQISTKIPKPSQPSASNVNKFNQIMKNARGFIKPSNLKLLGGFAKDLGAGIAIEFFAGWAIDRGLEAIGQDEKSVLERNVLQFSQLDKEKQKSIIERKNKELEKELEYQKTFFAKVEKVIALGDMTLNELKIKALASFLTAVSVSGAGSVYDLVSAGPLPNYLGSDVDTTLPSISKIGMPSLPPTGTGSPALAAAQQYGAPRTGGRKHAGVDFDITGNEKFYSRIGGVVIYAGNTGGAGGTGTGYGNVVDIYNKELDVTERIAEAKTILPGVVVGARIKPGQAVVQGEDLTPSGSIRTGVIHYEIRKGKAGRSGSFAGTLNPLKFLEEVMRKSQLQSSVRNSSSSLISSAGLDQSTTYSNSGLAVRREVNNILIPIRSA